MAIEKHMKERTEVGLDRGFCFAIARLLFAFWRRRNLRVPLPGPLAVYART